MMKQCQKINLKKQQLNRNATANCVNLIRTSTISRWTCHIIMGIFFLYLNYIYESRIKSFKQLLYVHFNHNQHTCTCTVLVLIKLTNFSVSVRFHCSCDDLIFLSLFHHVLRCLRTLNIVWSLMRRRVTLFNLLKTSTV